MSRRRITASLPHFWQAVMTLYRYVFTVTAFAFCQIAVAQTPPVPAESPTLEPADNLGATAQPRIIRGNDRVIAPATAVAPIEGPPVTFTFEEAPVAEVVRTILGDILKADYVLHPPLSGTITLSTRQPIPPDQAVFLLESALQVNGLALLRDARGAYHVGKPDALKGIGGSVRQVVGHGTLPPGYGAIIVPLQYIGAAEMAAILRPMMPAEALVRVDSIRNLLVLSGTRSQAEGWLDIVNTFDVDLLKGMSVGVFPLKYASIREVESALRLVGGGSANGAISSSMPMPSGAVANLPPQAAANAAAQNQALLSESNPLFGALRIIPIERLNSILVVTPRAAYLEEARRWIEKLDQPSDSNTEPQLFIYKVQNVNARHLATVLGGIFGSGAQQAGAINSGVAPGLSSAIGTSFGQANTAGSSALFGGTSGTSFSGPGVRGGGFGASGQNAFAARGNQQAPATQPPATAMLGNVRVMADDLNNSVLVWSTRTEYAKIEATLKRLDLPLTQVLIEASIVEVSLNDDLQYGLEWAFKDHRSETDYTGLGTLSAGTKDRKPLTELNNGFSYALKNPAGLVTAMLRALSQKTQVKVIASPSLMVLDNHSASIAVGNQTPIVVASTTKLDSNSSVQDYQYKDTGVNLTVTPSVNAGNIVTMQVEQSVTDVGGKDEVTQQRSFLQRQFSSKVAVRSGESIVMGGLIQERTTSSKAGLPVLHTLPIVGNLFGSTNSDGARTELIVIITPRVVRSDIDIREVSDDLRDRMRGLNNLDFIGRPDARTVAPVAPLPYTAPAN